MLLSLGARCKSKHLIGRCSIASKCVVSPTEHEPPPFDFEAIDQLVRSKPATPAKAIDINREDKSLFYWLLREANATVYAATALSKYTKQIAPTDTEVQGPNKPEGEWLCDRIADRLHYYKLDNRIIILQRALAAYHHSRQHQWHRLAKTALRSCLINDEVPNANHLVKICASLSKWRLTRITEIQTKLDLCILAESQWNLYSASHILWSLAHLKRFDMRSFDYMNNIVSMTLAEPAFDVAALSDDTMHRIVNANLIRLSHTGSHHRIMKDVLLTLSLNPSAISYLTPKTLLAVTSLLPLHPEATVASHLIRRISQSIHKFTHTQMAHVLYNFAIIRPNLAPAMIDDIVGMLFEFKETLYKSNAVYLPSLSCKLLFTFWAFLDGCDHKFISKCLSDLNTNLHLLVPYSLVGSLQCLEVYRDRNGTYCDEKQALSIANTWNNLVRVNDRGEFVKPSQCDLEEPVENLKLWHIAALHRITNRGYNKMLSQLNSFMDRVDQDMIMPALKDIIMFLYNVSTNRALCGDRTLLNSLLIVVSQLWNVLGNPNKYDEYWDHIQYNLAAMDLMEVLERECNNTLPCVGSSKSSYRISSMKLCIDATKGKAVDEALLACLHHAASAESCDYVELDSLVARYIMFICIFHETTLGKMLEDASTCFLRNVLTESFYEGFYEPMFNTAVNKGLDERLLEYLNKSLRLQISPPNLGMAYTTAFFLQDHIKPLLQTLPAIAMGALCSQKRYDISLWDLVTCFDSNGPIKLVDYLETVNEAKPEKNRPLQQIVSHLCRPVLNVKRVRTNFNVGPYMCHIGLFGDDESQGVYVFITDGYSKNARDMAAHVFDRQRRLTLKNMGLQFVDLGIDI